MIRLTECQHIFCELCISKYLYNRISDGKVSDISCPLCKESFSEHSLLILLHNIFEDDDLIVKYK